MKHDDIQIYKYTIASSKASEDGQWADEMFGCSFRDVTDTHGCAELGKTSCMSHTLAYNLHFVTNSITEAGDKDVAYWDDYVTGVHGKVTRPAIFSASTSASISKWAVSLLFPSPSAFFHTQPHRPHWHKPSNGLA
jgi:hypothetical protein